MVQDLTLVWLPPPQVTGTMAPAAFCLRHGVEMEDQGDLSTGCMSADCDMSGRFE